MLGRRRSLYNRLTALEAIDRFQHGHEYRIAFALSVLVPFKEGKVVCRTGFDMGLVGAALTKGLNGLLPTKDANTLDRNSRRHEEIT